MSSPTVTSVSGSTVDWGRTRHAAAFQEQEKLLARRIAGEAPDTLVFTEHEPVFTMGMRSGSDAHLVWGGERLATEGIEVLRTNRGGDITYHGPGQLVGYPIVSLEARRDLHAYLRFLEQVLINTLARLDLPQATRREGLTGIWLGSRKVAAIGVAVKRWVAYHGFALNVNPNLAHFGGIVPCGIAASDGTVTSLAAELRRPVDIAEVKPILAREFWTLWPLFLQGADPHS